MKLLKKLQKYLKACGIESADEGLFSLASEFPLAIASRYDARQVTLSGKTHILVEPIGEVSPNELIAAYRQIAAVHKPIVVLEFADKEYSDCLKAAKVNFVVPGRLMYVPPFAVLTPPEAYERGEKEFLRDFLSPWAQVVFIRAMLFHANERAIAYATLREELKIKDVYLTRACQELEYHRLASIEKDGRNRFIVLAGDRKLLWRSAEKCMRSPVVKTIRYAGEMENPLMAGYSALTLCSDLVPEDDAAFAISQQAARGLEKSKIQKYCGALVEIWRYDPSLLANDGSVDPLSLYLSLINSPDARIQIALSDLLEKVL